MLATAYRKLGELLENPNVESRTISSQSPHGSAKRGGVEQVQRLGGDERITRPRAPSPLKLVSRGDDIVRTARDNLQKLRLNAVTVTELDSLSAAAANKQIDGDDVGSFTAVTPTVRLGNYTQIMRKVGIIADNLTGAITEAGRRSELAYQLTKQGNELKRDMEFNLCGVNAAAAAGNASTARATASLSAFIKTHTSKGSGGADPTVSGGVVNAARTDGTQRAITEAMLKTVLQATWTQGGDPKFLMVGAHVKTVISGFAGIAEQRYMAPSDSPTTIIGAADVNSTLGVAA